jgi:V8-like Glu-specific endopeptidase
MFEHWDITEINLSKDRYLSYSIDTEVGESGSPVLRELAGATKIAPSKVKPLDFIKC